MHLCDSWQQYGVVASRLAHNTNRSNFCNTWYSARNSLGVFIMWLPQLVGRNVNTNHFVFSYARYYTSQAEFQTSAASRLARLFSYNWSQGGLYQTKYNTVLLSRAAKLAALSRNPADPWNLSIRAYLQIFATKMPYLQIFATKITFLNYMTQTQCLALILSVQDRINQSIANLLDW